MQLVVNAEHAGGHLVEALEDLVHAEVHDRADAVHHDGTNHYLYRVFKDGVTDTQIENLQDKIYNGKATRADITRVTKRLGDDIAGVYGFPIPKQRQTNEQAR